MFKNPFNRIPREYLNLGASTSLTGSIPILALRVKGVILPEQEAVPQGRRAAATLQSPGGEVPLALEQVPQEREAEERVPLESRVPQRYRGARYGEFPTPGKTREQVDRHPPLPALVPDVQVRNGEQVQNRSKDLPFQPAPHPDRVLL